MWYLSAERYIFLHGVEPALAQRVDPTMIPIPTDQPWDGSVLWIRHAGLSSSTWLFPDGTQVTDHAPSFDDAVATYRFVGTLDSGMAAEWLANRRVEIASRIGAMSVAP